MHNSDFYTAAEVARLVGVSVATLRTWRVSEKPKGPPFIRHESRTIRYRKTRVHAYIEAMEAGRPFDRRQGHPSIATKMANEAAAKTESAA